MKVKTLMEKGSCASKIAHGIELIVSGVDEFDKADGWDNDAIQQFVSDVLSRHYMETDITGRDRSHFIELLRKLIYSRL